MWSANKLIVDEQWRLSTFFFIQKVLVPPDVSPYIGVFRVDGLGALKNLEAKMKDGHIHLFTNGVEDIFLLNYTEPLIFQILSPSSLSCKSIFMLGAEHDLVVYDTPSPVDGLSDKFTMYGAHPSGRTYFYRVRDWTRTDPHLSLIGVYFLVRDHKLAVEPRTKGIRSSVSFFNKMINLLVFP